jgi:hypothetical protein
LSEFGQSGYKFLGMTGNEEVVYGLLHLLGTANACFNPILYGYLVTIIIIIIFIQFLKLQSTSLSMEMI